MNILEDFDYSLDSDVYGIVESDYTYQYWIPMQSVSRDIISMAWEAFDGGFIEYEQEHSKSMAQAAFETKSKR